TTSSSYPLSLHDALPIFTNVLDFLRVLNHPDAFHDIKSRYQLRIDHFIQPSMQTKTEMSLFKSQFFYIPFFHLIGNFFINLTFMSSVAGMEYNFKISLLSCLFIVSIIRDQKLFITGNQNDAITAGKP